jgi:hypothetical protein
MENFWNKLSDQSVNAEIFRKVQCQFSTLTDVAIKIIVVKINIFKIVS